MEYRFILKTDSFILYKEIAFKSIQNKSDTDII